LPCTVPDNTALIDPKLKQLIPKNTKTSTVSGPSCPVFSTVPGRRDQRKCPHTTSTAQLVGTDVGHKSTGHNAALPHVATSPYLHGNRIHFMHGFFSFRTPAQIAVAWGARHPLAAKYSGAKVEWRGPQPSSRLGAATFICQSNRSGFLGVIGWGPCLRYVEHHRISKAVYKNADMAMY
jgi:hypothetical protein